MNLFEKLCCIIAVALALFFLVLGIPGTFSGCSFNFNLPPILGVLPALVGWGIIRAVMIAWKKPTKAQLQSAQQKDFLG